MEPILITPIVGVDFVLAPKSSFRLMPVYSDGLYCIDKPEWNLHVFSENYSDLKREVEDQLIMLWMEFGREDDEGLVTSARLLKRSLHLDFKEVIQDPWVAKAIELCEESLHLASKMTGCNKTDDFFDC
jgi:hypothetical protein